MLPCLYTGNFFSVERRREGDNVNRERPADLCSPTTSTERDVPACLSHVRVFVHRHAQALVREALAVPSRFYGRNSLHVVSLREGKGSRLWNAVVRVELAASGNLEYVMIFGVAWSWVGWERYDDDACCTFCDRSSWPSAAEYRAVGVIIAP